MYGKLQNISTKLIKQFGVPCVVRSEKAGRYNPETGEVESRSRSEESAHCLFDNLAYDFNQIGKNTSNMVQQGDVLIYVTAEANPAINSKIVTDNEKWTVINCQPIKPAGVAVIYQCQARKVE